MIKLLQGDCVEQLRTLPADSVQCCVALAYCAGVIDSDGTIGVKRSTYAARVVGNCTQATYSERVCVRQVEPQAIDLLHALFGGSRGVTKPSAANGRALYSWSVTDKRAITCLSAVLPYLRIKRAQAENCLALRVVKEQSKAARVAVGRKHIGAAKRPAAMTDAMEEHFRRAKVLNVVGVRA